ncbi:hypothetical protein MASR2M78_32440 [Treponema sp.]
MGSYYYLVAQLPAISYAAAPPISSVEFKELAGDLLTSPDAALLSACTLDPEPLISEAASRTSSFLIEQWRIWEGALRLNLAKLRSQKLKWDSLIEAPNDPMDAIAVARAAMALESPLEAELFLDRSRWEAIEAFSGFDYFGRDTVYAYLLKLYLLERKALFRVEEGFAEYKAIYASVMEAAPTSIESGDPK